MKQTLEIPIELPDLNKVIEMSKKHWSEYSKQKKRFNVVIASYAKKQLKPVKKIADIHCHWVCKDRRKDKDNIAAGLKFILDGLVEAKIIKNDGWNWIGNISHTFEVDETIPSYKRKSRVLVTITEK